VEAAIYASSRLGQWHDDETARPAMEQFAGFHSSTILAPPPCAVSNRWRRGPTSLRSSFWCSYFDCNDPATRVETRFLTPPSPTATRCARRPDSLVPLCPLYAQRPPYYVLYILSYPLRFILADLDRVRLRGIVRKWWRWSHLPPPPADHLQHGTQVWFHLSTFFPQIAFVFKFRTIRMFRVIFGGNILTDVS
jgi:hypothetical protein